MPIGSRGGPPVFIGGLGGPRAIGRFVEQPAQSGDDILANGDFVTSTVSLIDGVAAADGVVSGSTIAAAVSIATAGTAIGEAAAVGSTVSVVSSFIDGTASGEGSASGSTISATSALTSGTAIGSAGAGADTLTATTSLIDGVAVAENPDASVDGVTLTAVTSLLPGQAGEGEVIPPQSMPQAFIVGGPVHFERFREDGEAEGATLYIRARIIPGKALATQSALVAHRTLTRAIDLLPGVATASALTPSTGLLTRCELAAGEAKGFDSVKHDNEFFLIAA